jgi:uncharacterized protein
MSVAAHIKPTLAQIEKDRAVKIWCAVESGSRAWGFESTSSGLDVRFSYSSALNNSYFAV